MIPKPSSRALSIVLVVKLFGQPSFPMASICGSSIPRVYGIFAVPSKNPTSRQNHNICHHLSFWNPHFRNGWLPFWFLALIFIAIDKSAINVADSLGFQLSTSLVLWVFVSYTFLHFSFDLVFFLGIWIPTFPKIDNFIAISSKKMKCRLLQNEKPQIQQVAHWPHIHLHFLICFHFFLPKNQPIDLAILLARV